MHSGAATEGTIRQPQDDPLLQMIGVDDIEPMDVDEVVYGESTMKQSRVLVAWSGECIGILKSLLAAHRISHLFLKTWPELAPLVLVDSAHQDRWWTVKLGDCSPLYCDIALSYAPYRDLVSHQETVELMGDPAAQREIAESEAEYARGEFITGDEARALFGLPPVSDSLTNSGLPVRVPAVLPVRAMDVVIDVELLRRVVERLRRL